MRALDAARREIIGETLPEGGNDSPQRLPDCPSLMCLASRGGGRVPLDAVVRFVRLARSNNQKEVVEILAEPTIRVTKVSWN